MEKTGLWWDMSSCEFPSYFPPSLALHVAPSLLHKFALHSSNGCVTTNAYSYKQNGELQNTLKKAGFKLQILPSGSEKKKIEKTMVGDVKLWITKNPPPANIIMLLGSSNMNKALRKLHYKGYKIFICNVNFSETYKEMLEVCDKHISWSHFLSLLLNEYEILRGFVQNGNCNTPLSSFPDSTYKNSSFMESKIRSRDHVRPGFSSKNKYSNKTLGFGEFKAWLLETVGSEKYKDEGYDISGIPRDFLSSTGMRLQLNLLGCSKLIQLVQLCNDVVTLVQLDHGYNVVFPRPQEHVNSVSKKGGVKATMLQFHGFICRMMLLGDFSKGLLLCALAEKFKERSGLLLDYKDLGHVRLSDLVAPCCVVSIQSDGPGRSLVILSTEGKMYLKQIRKNRKYTKSITLKTITGKNMPCFHDSWSLASSPLAGDSRSLASSLLVEHSLSLAGDSWSLASSPLAGDSLSLASSPLASSFSLASSPLAGDSLSLASSPLASPLSLASSPLASSPLAGDSLSLASSPLAGDSLSLAGSPLAGDSWSLPSSPLARDSWSLASSPLIRTIKFLAAFLAFIAISIMFLAAFLAFIAISIMFLPAFLAFIAISCGF